MPEPRGGRAAAPVSFGLALIGVGSILAWLLPEGRWHLAALGPLSLGLCFLVWGVYMLVDGIERR